MEKTAEEEGIKYPIARDPNLKSMKAANVMWFPTYAVVDRKGVYRASGVLDNKGMEEIIKKLLKEEAPEDGGDDDGADQAEEQTASIPAAWYEGRNPDRSAVDALQGKPAPELQVADWMNVDDLDVDLSDGLQWEELEGKVVLLDYWATW